MRVGASQIEEAYIERAKDNVGEQAQIKKILPNKKSQNYVYRVRAGKLAECIFPSGKRVRVKVGEDSPSWYGECGADPEIFASIWIDKKKVASREWFTGHCRERWSNPDVAYRVLFTTGEKSSEFVNKCHTQQIEEKLTGSAKSKEPLSVCVEYPAISYFPRDYTEYPKAGQKPPKVGKLLKLSGTHPVCDETLKELKSTKGSRHFQHPVWTKTSVKLPENIRDSDQGIFDIDNDGRVDRVFHQSNSSHYAEGDTLLIQSGAFAPKSGFVDQVVNKSSWFIPCQMDETPHAINDCPGFSQKADESGAFLEGKTGQKDVFFHARYSVLSPFIFRGQSFIKMESNFIDTKNFYAVVKPMPHKKFEQVCLFERVAENF
jgi:hypothetical protein